MLLCIACCIYVLARKAASAAAADSRQSPRPWSAPSSLGQNRSTLPKYREAILAEVEKEIEGVRAHVQARNADVNERITKTFGVTKKWIEDLGDMSGARFAETQASLTEISDTLKLLHAQFVRLDSRVEALHGIVKSLAPSQSAYRQAVFEHIYSSHLWGEDGGGSGGGSTLASTADLRQALAALIRAWDVRRIVDAGCGSLAWVPQLLANVAAAEFAEAGPRDVALDYCGMDIAHTVIERHRSKEKAWQALGACGGGGPLDAPPQIVEEEIGQQRCLAVPMRFVVADVTARESWRTALESCGFQEMRSVDASDSPVESRSRTALLGRTLVMCRDVLQHMTFSESLRTLSNLAEAASPSHGAATVLEKDLSSSPLLLLLSSYPSTAVNVDIPMEAEHPRLLPGQGQGAVTPQPPHNLRLPPFSLPEPIAEVSEGPSGKVMLLYRAEDVLASLSVKSAAADDGG